LLYCVFLHPKLTGTWTSFAYLFVFVTGLNILRIGFALLVVKIELKCSKFSVVRIVFHLLRIDIIYHFLVCLVGFEFVFRTKAILFIGLRVDRRECYFPSTLVRRLIMLVAP